VDPRYYGEYAASILKWLDDTQQGNYNHDAVRRCFSPMTTGECDPKVCNFPCGPLCGRYGDLVWINDLCNELHQLSVLAEQYSVAKNRPTLHVTMKRIYSVSETVLFGIRDVANHCQFCNQKTN
jgi:hypothetical protein